MKNEAPAIALLGDINSPHFQSWIVGCQEAFPNCKMFVLDLSSKNITKNAKKFINKTNPSIYYYYYSLSHRPLKLRDILNQYKLNQNLKNALRKKFDFIHLHNFQTAGYEIFKKMELLDFVISNKNLGCKIIFTSYGSDLKWFSKINHHHNLIQHLLKFIDVVVVETKEEIEILRSELKYSAHIVYIAANSLGIDKNDIFSDGNIFDRKIILIKGNWGFVGRPMAGLDILLPLKSILKDMNYRVVIYSLPDSAKSSVETVLEQLEVPYEIYGEQFLSKDSMLKLFRKAKIFIGCSLSDGLATSAIEASSQGTIVFQTNSAGVKEHVELGFHIFEIDLYNLGKSILNLKAVLENELPIDEISQSNIAYIKKVFAREEIIKKLKEVYSS